MYPLHKFVMEQLELSADRPMEVLGVGILVGLTICLYNGQAKPALAALAAEQQIYY